MRKLINLVVTLAAALAAASCDWGFEVILPSGPSVFVVNQNTDIVELGPEAQTQSVYIASDMLWNAAMKEGTWCTLKEKSYYNEFTSTLSFMLQANNSEDKRTDSLIVVSGGQRRAIAIVQLGYSGAFSADEIVLPGNVPVQYQLKATANWTLQKEGGWFSVSPQSGNGNSIITVQAADDNKNLEPREGSVTFILNGVKVTVPVKQGITQTIIVERTEVNIPGVASTFVIGTHTNVDYQLSIDVPWIKEEPKTKSLNDFQHSFSAEANSLAEPREGHITFSYENISETVTVTQDARETIVDITTPGFYGVQGNDYIYRKTTSQTSRFTTSDSRSYRLIYPKEGCVVQIQGVPLELETGAALQLGVSVYKGGQAIYSQPVNATLIAMDSELMWIKCSNITYFIIKK